MLSTGTRLGPYEIVALIGSGGMGEVYRARDTRLGRDVAVKVIRGAAASDPDRLERFEQEARTTGLLNHPNVLAIYDVGTFEGSPYLVSELLEGATIRVRLASGPLPPSKVISYATQIAEGLAAAHAKGIVHRDLKPENVFVTTDGRIKILDFGLAKLVNANGPYGVDSQAPTAETEGPTVGTVSYMSPEQIRGQPVDHRSDIFSFGVLLYEMMTGQRAFRGASAVETMNAALKEDPPDLGRLPEGVAAIVQHCIEKDPEHRFQSAPDLAFHLKSLSGTSLSGRLSVSLGPRRPRRLTPARVLGILAAFGILGIGLVAGRVTAPISKQSFVQLTFRRGIVFSARFAPDGETALYGASWEGQPFRVFSTRPESPESRDLGLPPADVLSVSRSGELAVSLGMRIVLGPESRGLLARVPISGGAPREILADVQSADWAPDGRNLAAIHVVKGRYRLEFPLGTVLYESDGWLGNARLSHSGRQIAFVEHPVRADDRGDVCIIDSRAGKRGGVRRVAPSWSSVTGLVWSDDDREVWFSAAAVGGHSEIFAVAASGRRRLVLEAPGRLAIHDLRGSRALVTEERLRLRLSLRDLRDPLAPDKDLSWLDSSVGVDLTQDGRTLLFGEQGVGARSQAYASYLRGTDGSPAVRLGEGMAQSLAPDRSLVATIALHASGRSSIALLPTGPGEERSLPPGPVTQVDAVTWFPDGRKVLFAGNEPGKETRLYVQHIEEGPPRPVSEPGVGIPFGSQVVSPDGLSAAAVDRERNLVIQPTNGSPLHVVPATSGHLVPIRWAADGRSLYAYRRDEFPARLLRVDTQTGSAASIAEIAPPDRAGVRPPITVQLTPDASLCTYTYSQTLADLFLVQGLK